MKKSPARNMLLKKAPSKLLERINSSIDVDVRLFQEDIEASSVHCKILENIRGPDRAGPDQAGPDQAGLLININYY